MFGRLIGAILLSLAAIMAIWVLVLVALVAWAAVVRARRISPQVPIPALTKRGQVS